jgi:hypothetical protein
MTEVEKAAIAWWKCHRPVVYTKKEHLKNPTINMPMFCEKKLARSVAKMIERPQRTAPRGESK